MNQCCVYSLEKWSTKVILLEELVCFSAWVKKIQPSGISEVALLYTPVPGNRAFSVTYRKIHPSFPPPFFRFSINFTQTTLIKNRPKANNVVTPGYTLNPEKDKKKTTQMDVVFFLSETHFYWRTRLLIPVQMGSDRSRAENRECSST